MAQTHHNMDADPKASARLRTASRSLKTDSLQVLAWIVIMILSYLMHQANNV